MGSVPPHPSRSMAPPRQRALERAAARIPRTLTWKLVLSVSLVLTAALGLHMVLNDPSEIVFEQKRIETERFGDIAAAIVVKEMLSGQPERVQDHLDLIEVHAEVQRIRILDDEGVIRFASDPADIGQKLDVRSDPICTRCHVDEQDPTISLVRDDSGTIPVFTYSLCLEFEDACLRCHADASDRVGKILVDLTATGPDRLALAANRRLLASTGMLLLVMTLVVWGVTRALIQKPIRRLVDATTQIEAGRFDPSLPKSTGDELGSLSLAIGRMAKRLGTVVQDQEDALETRSEQLRESERRLLQETRLAVVGRMTAGTAHEIGNPSSAISALAELIRHRSQDPEVRELCNEILAHVDRIARLVRDLTQSTRSLPDPNESTQVSVAVHKAWRMVRLDRGLGEDHRLDLEEVEGCPPLGIAEADLLQVLINVLLNSVDAMEGGGRILVYATPVETGVEVRILDEGVGLQQADRDQLLEPFYTTKPLGKGTGLGLWICYSILEKYHGSIEIGSRPDGGAEAILRFPHVKNEAIVHA